MVVAGRGVGKTTIIADENLDLLRKLPRGKIGLIGMSYFHIKTKSMPVIINHWEKKGYYKDLHYFVGRKPPKSWQWKEAYQPPIDYKNCVIFWNGFTIEFVSLDRPEMARSASYDFLIGDEAAQIKEYVLNSDILPTNRGNNDRFGHIQKHHGSLFVTTHAIKPEGEWIYKYKDFAKEDKNYMYLEASAEDNIQNLGEDYFRHQKRVMDPNVYNLEILNIRPNARSNSFYPKFSIIEHTYDAIYNYSFLDKFEIENGTYDSGDARKDKDVDAKRALDISFDFGSKINCLVVGQEQFPKYRVLKDFYTRQPLVLRDLVDNFIQYYKYHENKLVYLYGGSDGRKRSDYDSTLSFFDKIKKQLNDAGWTVVDAYRLTEIPHKDKFQFFIELYGGLNPNYPEVLFNAENAKATILSIQNSPMMDNAIEKDKSAERANVDQVKTTHLSDAKDNLLYWKFAADEMAQRNFMPTRM